MNNQSKKLQDLRESNNAVFQEIFGFGKKESKVGDRGNLNISGLMYEDDVVKINPDWSVEFKATGSVVGKPLPGYAAFTNQDWSSEGLKWLVNSDFVAESMQIKNGKVDRFIGGKWYAGTFKGRAFIKGQFGVKNGNKAYFSGGKFIDSTWLPSPHYFLDGTTNESETILGFRNIQTMNQNRFKFNIIAVVTGRRIIMEMEDGVIHEVAVIKRLDESNSSFNYRVKNGHSGEVFTLPLRWSAIRGNNEGEFIQLTTLSNDRVPALFTNTFGLQFNSPIARVMITDDTEYGQKNVEKKGEAPEETPADLSKKQVSFELSNIPFLGIDKIPRRGGSETSLYFNFPTPNIKNEYNNIIGLLKQGWVSAYVKQLKSALDNGIIKGAPINYNFLGALIGKDSGADVKTLDKDTINALNGIESFLKSFVDIMVRRVRKTGAEKGVYDIEDTIGKQMIKDKLRAILGVEGNTQEPAQKSAQKPGSAPFPKAKIAESTGVRNMVQDILSKNLKHI
jgi:hypothetical protein